MSVNYLKKQEKYVYNFKQKEELICFQQSSRFVNAIMSYFILSHIKERKVNPLNDS